MFRVFQCLPPAPSHYEVKSCVLFLLKQGWNSDNEKDDDLCRIPISLSPVNQPKVYCSQHLTTLLTYLQNEKAGLVWAPKRAVARLSHLWLSYFLTEKKCTWRWFEMSLGFRDSMKPDPTLRHLPNLRRCHGHSGEKEKEPNHGTTQSEGPQKGNGIQSVFSHSYSIVFNLYCCTVTFEYGSRLW